MVETTKRSEVWYEQAREVLQRLRYLPHNWDSYGAEPPNGIAIYGAGEALITLRRLNFPAPQVAASVEDGVAITYRQGSKSATIEFFNTGEIVAVRSDGEGDVRAWEVGQGEEHLESGILKIREFLYG